MKMTRPVEICCRKMEIAWLPRWTWAVRVLTRLPKPSPTTKATSPSTSALKPSLRMRVAAPCWTFAVDHA